MSSTFAFCPGATVKTAINHLITIELKKSNFLGIPVVLKPLCYSTRPNLVRVPHTSVHINPTLDVYNRQEKCPSEFQTQNHEVKSIFQPFLSLVFRQGAAVSNLGEFYEKCLFLIS